MDGSPYMPETPEYFGFGATLDPNGHFCKREQVEYALARAREQAAVQWYSPTEKPEQGEQVLGEWQPEIYRMYYVDASDVWREIDMQGRQRPNSTTVPLRWMRIPQEATPPAPPADTESPNEIPPLLQRLVDAIKREWPWQLAMDAADISPYDEPDIGAPLE